jgi:hypothetical protein
MASHCSTSLPVPREWDDYLMSLPGLPTTNYSHSHTAVHSQFLSPWVEDHLYPLVMILLEMIEYVTIPGLEKSTHVVIHWQIGTHTHLVELPVQMFCSCCKSSQWHCNAKIDLAPWSSISAPASTSATRSGSLIQMSKYITIHQWRWCLLIQIYMERTSKTCIAISVL